MLRYLYFMTTHDEVLVLTEKPKAHRSPLWILISAALFALVASAVVLVSSRPSSAAGMTTRLMSVGDLPAGWSVNPAPATSVLSHNQCLVGLGTGSGAKTVESTADFTENSSLPLFHELLSSGRENKADFKKAVKALSNCATLTFVEGGRTIHGTIQPLSLGSLGATSAAFT